MSRRREVKAALLGATGAVGQRYINMLPDHPFIELDVLMGGESAGKSGRMRTVSLSWRHRLRACS